MSEHAKPVGRFAPSPTGYMHLGNARSSLLAWLQSRSQNGWMILRIEDVDRTRARDYAYDAIRRDLEWLGLDWDREYIQSERSAHYEEALKALELYTCVCTRKEIQAAASAPHGSEQVYPGSCRKSQHAAPQGALRWKIPAGQIRVEDRRLGTLTQDLRTEVGDVVLRRKDGCYAYHLAVVVDDALMGVSEVVRGEDLWPSTPRQVALQEALGYPRPHYLHLPLMHDFRGERLAKRNGAPALKVLRESGEDPARVLAELARSLGWKTPEACSAQELLKEYGPQLCQSRVTFPNETQDHDKNDQSDI